MPNFSSMTGRGIPVFWASSALVMRGFGTYVPSESTPIRRFVMMQVHNKHISCRRQQILCNRIILLMHLHHFPGIPGPRSSRRRAHLLLAQRKPTTGLRWPGGPLRSRAAARSTFAGTVKPPPRLTFAEVEVAVSAAQSTHGVTYCAYQSSVQLERWLGEVLTAPERERTSAFLAEAVPAGRRAANRVADSLAAR